MSIQNLHSTFLLRKSKFLWIMVLACIFYSCNSTKYLKEDEVLLRKVKFKYNSRPILKDEIKSLSKQKPNRKLLGIFNLYVGAYNLYYNKPESKVRENIAEAPVVYDSTLNIKSLENMTKHLRNKGYYDNNLTASHKIKGKRAYLTYKVDLGKLYRINNTEVEIEDSAVAKVINSKAVNPLVNKGEPFDLEIIDKERKSIEKQLKNKGYYKFSKDFVVFEVDSSMSKKEVDIKTTIKNRKLSGEVIDSLYSIGHQVFNISKVYVRMNVKNNKDGLINKDTVSFDSINFININPKKLKPQALARLVYLRPGDIFRQDLQELTYKNLSGLKIFSYISITYEDDPASPNNRLIAYIDLTPRKPKSYTVQTEGTNTGGNLGINGTLSFQNINTFKSGENLKVEIHGGLEAQTILTDDADVVDDFLPFNTYEYGPEVSLTVPRFILPFNASKFSQKVNPRTTFSTSYNVEQRPDYRRNISKTFVSYSWNETSTKTHIIQPVDISFIQLDESEAFKKELEEIDDPFLRNSYTDNFILSSKYSFILNTQAENILNNYIYFRGNIETAGNLLSLLTNNSKKVEGENYKEIAGIRYAQYVRTDIDFRFYQNAEYNQMVYRFATGVGLPYGNSISMPFEKSFYAGGSNDIRAWQARELGPGNLADSSKGAVDQIGNMSIIGSVEFRFDVTKVIEGAAFIDAGNIWNLNQDEGREETQFAFNTLWQSLAIGPGIGIRFNFSFFIFRFDFATPIKDPGKPNPFEIKPQWDKTNLNFGIGYPF